MLLFLSTSEEALEVYKTLKETLQTTGLQLRNNQPPEAQDLGSAPLQQVCHTVTAHYLNSLHILLTVLSKQEK